MEENRRDAGLVRALGPWGFAASIVNVVVGAGIFAAPASLAATVGPYAPFAFLACAIAVGSIAICFAEGGSRVATSGGVYGCIEAAFGPLAGYVAGNLLWFSNLLACGGIAAALADIVASLGPAEWREVVRVVTVVVMIGGIAFVNIGGVALGARFIGTVTVIKLIPLALFVVVGAFAIDGANFTATVPMTTEKLGSALILALFTFTGMETALCASGEVRDPCRTIPRALAIAMMSVTLLYIAIQVVAQGILGADLGKSTVPLADAMARISPALSALLLGGAAISMFAYLGSDLLATPRMLFAFARDGALPRALGEIHPTRRTPHYAIISYATLAIVLALVGTFAQLAILSTLMVTVPYIGGCAAAWKLSRQGIARCGPPLNFRWLVVAVVIGIASMIVLIALAAPMEILGLAGAIGVCIALYFVLNRGATLTRAS